MEFIYGIYNGSVLQRNAEDLCEAEIKVTGAEQLQCSVGTVEKLCEDTWLLRGIPAGGPYELVFDNGTTTKIFTDIYVGDVWVLGGQSNMDGTARIMPDDLEYAKNPQPQVRAFYMDESWGPACYDIHNKVIAKEKPYIDSVESWLKNIAERNLRVYDAPPYRLGRCVGPGVSFAGELFRLSGGIPQGVIPCAVGGAPIEMWLPPADGSENYYTAALHRIRLCGNRVRGMFWAQGEGNPNWEIYPEQIEIIRKGICEQTKMEILPFVQMQSFRYTIDIGEECSFVWSRFREMQRNMPKICPCLSTIATNDCALDDCIHLDSASQKKMGKRGARAMYRLTTGCGFAEPDLDEIILQPFGVLPDSCTLLRIRYKNLKGALQAFGNPSGFCLSLGDEKPSIQYMTRVSLLENEVQILMELPIEALKKYKIWYGFGHEFYCNITDEGGRAIPSMGPIVLQDYRK